MPYFVCGNVQVSSSTRTDRVNFQVGKVEISEGLVK